MATGASPSQGATPAAGAPANPGAQTRRTKDIAILSFHHIHDAERAYAAVRDLDPAAPWLTEVAFVECHHKGRIVVRGTFAGRYVDVEDVGDAMGRETVEGALAGAVVGLAFGPPGFAAGLVGGGAIGGLAHARHVEEHVGRLFDEIRDDVPEGSSAVVIYAAAADVDAAVAAFGDRPLQVERHRPSPEEAQALEEAVQWAPPAAPRPAPPPSEPER